jgi:hypothetical protein
MVMVLDVPQAMDALAQRKGLKSPAKRLLIVAGWALVVLLFASQWYAYDASHGLREPFIYYLGWSCYMWGVLTPLAVWIAWRHPIASGTWLRNIPLHLAISVLLTTAQLSVEAGIKWLRAGDWPLAAVLQHYLGQHTQIGLLTYWLLVAATQFYRMYDQARTRQLHTAQLEARLAKARIENLRTQLHPHFLFNTLQAVATLIQENPSAAEEMVLRLSELLRASLEGTRAHEISLAREVQVLEHYIAIQQRRFGERLRFEVQIDPDLLACAVPTLVLQPLVENAIRHGITKHKEGDVVTVRGFRNGDYLCLEVVNLTSKLELTPEQLWSRGIGLSNTRERLAQLYGKEQSLRLANLEPAGVCVQLFLPIRQVSYENAASEMATA